MSDSPPDPPVEFNDVGHRWVRTEITTGKHLVNGQAWLAQFKANVEEVKATGSGRRLLRPAVTEGDDPRYHGANNSSVVNVGIRNQALKKMPGEAKAGTKVKLVTGEEVIFWFNVGPPGSLKDRVYVTDSRCPHQGFCLSEGELMDVEDLHGCKTGMIRCRMHNKVFNLHSGLSHGSSEELKIYPCRFEHGHWYVAVGKCDLPENPSAGSSDTEPMDVDMDDVSEPECKRAKQEENSAAAPFLPEQVQQTPHRPRALTYATTLM